MQRRSIISLALEGYRRDVNKRNRERGISKVELPTLKPGVIGYADINPFKISKFDPSAQKNFISIIFEVDGANEPRLMNLVNALPLFDNNLGIVKYDIPLLFGVPDYSKPAKRGEYPPLVRVVDNQLWFEQDGELAIETMARVLKVRRHGHDKTHLMPVPVEDFLDYGSPSKIDLNKRVESSWRPEPSSPLSVEDRQMIRGLLKLRRN